MRASERKSLGFMTQFRIPGELGDILERTPAQDGRRRDMLYIVTDNKYFSTHVLNTILI